jgi:hypothetical protein
MPAATASLATASDPAAVADRSEQVDPVPPWELVPGDDAVERLSAQPVQRRVRARLDGDGERAVTVVPVPERPGLRNAKDAERLFDRV